MRFCDVKKYLLGIFLIGIGLGILLCRVWGLGCICAIAFIGVGIWRMF